MTTETSPRTTPSPTVVRLLDEELATSPVVQRHYSSHLAMSLAALHRLGAPSERLQEWFDADRDAEPRDDRDELDVRLREIARDGIAATVRDRVPSLVDGPSSQLFHPAIRLSYGLDLGHEGQVAAALLDWQRRHEVLPVDPPRTGDRRLGDAAADLAAHPAGTWDRTFDLPGIARRRELVSARDGIAVDERTLDDISAFALAAHASADDFITLHLVTGARAIRQVSAWIDAAAARRLAARTIDAMLVGYAAVGAPPLLDADGLDALRRADVPTRDAVAARAVADRDPHVVKLVDVALVEEERTGDPLHRYVAARAVGLVSTGRHS